MIGTDNKQRKVRRSETGLFSGKLPSEATMGNCCQDYNKEEIPAESFLCFPTDTS